jgi:hypothetical protein
MSKRGQHRVADRAQEHVRTARSVALLSATPSTVAQSFRLKERVGRASVRANLDPAHAATAANPQQMRRYTKLEARLMLTARITVLNPNEIRPCSSTTRRSPRETTATSETWQVIPMTNEK